MRFSLFAFTLVLLLLVTNVSQAAASQCSDLPDHDALKSALQAARAEANGGLNLDMWATIVDRDGVVCAVTYSGATPGAQWPGSRVISAQKAYTANAFSLDGLALSTANLYSAVQPGGSLFGLQESNPINFTEAYRNTPNLFGSRNDPMINRIIGGVNVFGGGLALYNSQGKIVGGLGVSGDTSCADHNIAWRVRNTLSLDYVTTGVAPTKNDQVIYDITGGKSKTGFGHPTCGGSEHTIAAMLITTRTPELPQ